MYKRSKLSYLFNGLAAVGGASTALLATTVLSIDGSCGTWTGCFYFPYELKAALWTANAVGATSLAMGLTGYIGRDKSKPNMLQRGVALLNQAVNGQPKP